LVTSLVVSLIVNVPFSQFSALVFTNLACKGEIVHFDFELMGRSVSCGCVLEVKRHLLHFFFFLLFPSWEAKDALKQQLIATNPNMNTKSWKTQRRVWKSKTVPFLSKDGINGCWAVLWFCQEPWVPVL
jgi:hypothetical protein